MASAPNTLLPFAMRVNAEWSAKLEAQLALHDIVVLNHWPAAADDWNPHWGDGDAFVGFRDDPAQIVLGLCSANAASAAAKAMTVANLDVSDFEVMPQFDSTFGRGAFQLDSSRTQVWISDPVGPSLAPLKER